ncbi:MAG: hypothetical protein QGH23_06090, partial [Dehalococcoidia bacterium]|nr:hypothetical protein [Dehalococcoidia bacterium]
TGVSGGSVGCGVAAGVGACVGTGVAIKSGGGAGAWLQAPEAIPSISAASKSRNTTDFRCFRCAMSGS